MNTQNLLAENGLDWTVSKHQEINPVNGNLTPYYCVIRDDTQEVLKSGFSSQYTPIQNSEAFNFLDVIAQDYTIHKMGYFKGGKKTFATVNIGSKKILEVDELINRVSFVNSNDGSSGLTFQKSIERCFCSNQQTHLEQSDRFSIPHTISAHGKLDKIIKAIETSQISFELTTKLFEKMADIKISTNEGFSFIQDYLKTLEKEGRAETIARNKLEYIYAGFINPDGLDMGFRTVWDLYNAFTRYTSHYQNNSHKAESKLMGALNRENSNILDTITTQFEVV